MALLVFATATAVTFGELWHRGPTTTVITRAVLVEDYGEGATLWRGFATADATFEAWLVSRHARTLVTRPWALFDTEHCAPTERSLTLGIPMITMGVLGIPAQLAFNEPILTYNISILLLILAAAFAAFAVVRDWTDEPAAGIVAGLLFGFAASRLGHIEHPSVLDIAWAGYALYFAHRLLAYGRWRDAVGLALAGVLQIWASFYTLLAAVLVLPPVGIWLVRRFGLRHVRISQLAFVASATLGGALVLFPPYLAARDALGILTRSDAEYQFAAWSDFFPSGELYFGSMACVLAAVALLVRSRTLFPGAMGNPRVALVMAVLLATAISTGPNLLHPVSDAPVRWGMAAPASSINLYGLAAQVIPGLDAIRGVIRLSTGAQLAISILAGIGAAGLLRLSGRYRGIVAIALITLAFVDVTRPGDLPLPKSFSWDYADARASDSAIEFFETLAVQGDHGPLLEVPIAKKLGLLVVAPKRIMLSAHHHRRTSACFGSYLPASNVELESLSLQLPDADAAERLRDLGFATVILDRRAYWAAGFKSRQRQAVRDGNRPLPLIHANDDLAAYSLRVN